MEKTTNQNKNSLLKLTILAISLMISAASAISVTLPMIKNQFPDISAATVESLVTIPSFTMMVFILLSSFIIKRIGEKKTVILGLSLAFVGGIVPAFVTNFDVIFVSRFILGAGTGIYNSLAISLIGDYFSGETQQKMLGYQSAFSTLGSSFVTFLAGLLVNISWQYSYLIYFFTLPIALMVIFFLPEKTKPAASSNEQADNESKSTKQSVNSLVIFSCVMMFFFFVLVMNIYTKTSTLIIDENYANQGFLGTTMTIGSLVGALGGFVYSHIRRLFKNLTPVIALGAVALTYFLIPYAGNMFSLTIILAVGFVVVSTFIPYMYDILLPGAPENSSNLAVSLAMVACNLGSFFSPYVIQMLGSLTGNTSAAFSFTIGGALFVAMAIIFLVRNIFQTKAVALSSEK